MNLFFDPIFHILVTAPGNLVYHIVVVFSIAGSLQGAIHLLRSTGFPQARRTVFGLTILLLLQVLMFVISGLGWQGLVNAETLLPPFDRAISLLALVWIAWLWAFPEPVRLADAGALLLNLLALTFFGLTLAFWSSQAGTEFNQSAFELGWQGFSVAAALLGIVVLVIRRPNGWGNGIAMLVLGFVGHLVSLVAPTSGDYPGIVRLTQLAFFPILLTLPQRFPVPTASGARPAPVKAEKDKDKKEKSEEQPPMQDRRRYSTDPKTFHALMSLAAETDPDKVGQAMTRGIAQAMLADLCFLLTLTSDKSLVISCGYDLIREESLGGAAVDKDSVPLLANAIQRGRPLRLPASSTSSDLKGLGHILGLSNPGHLLSVPILVHGRGAIGGILILSPYSNRLWSAEDQTYLSNVSSLFVPIMERGQRMASLENERDNAVAQVKNAQELSMEAQKKAAEVSKELEEHREKISQAQLQAENMAALLIMQEESQKTIEKLQHENEQLHSGNGLMANDGQMERELRQALQEMARMQNALAEANIKILELEKRPAAPITTEQVDVIASISQELRQPMSSIVGYTDLLLGESVGILGALQRKFIERIKASTERIGGLVDDLIQITNLETGKMEFKPEPIDLNLIIDNAMAYTSTQIREKNITLRLDIPDAPPRIQTDRDALQQILIHLLQNATAATHAEGNITLRVRMESENGSHFLSVQVADSGGGISSEDVPRVFARRYRAEHSLIQGLGDTGVGLSIAKTLVEAQHGRIWVETETGVGSTFSVLMPIIIETEE